MACDHHNNYVLDTRDHEFGIRRRRECADCGFRWSTLEIALDTNTRGKDPWAEYRRLAIRKWLRQMLDRMDDDDD